MNARGGPWRLGSTGAASPTPAHPSSLPPSLLSSSRKSLQTEPGSRREEQKGEGGRSVATSVTPAIYSWQTSRGDWGEQELSVAMSALAKLLSCPVSPSFSSASSSYSSYNTSEGEEAARDLILQALQRLADMAGRNSQKLARHSICYRTRL